MTATHRLLAVASLSKLSVPPTPMKTLFSPIAFAALLTLSLYAAPPAKVELQKGESVAIVGNALADRMQHDGTLEAFIHKAHPQDDITIRNLGFAADEVNSHMRSDDVPKTEWWLEKAK